MNLTKKSILLIAIICSKFSFAQFSTGPGNITQPTTAGNVGIGYPSYTPLCLLEVKNGSVLFDGATGLYPGLSGAGIRMLWYPGKKAFRAGEVSSTQWDDINIGLNSFACNINTTASGAQSSAFGNGTATGVRATAFGNSTASNTGATSFNGGLASGSGSFAINGTASGNSSFSSGNGAVSSGLYACSFGSNTTAFGYYSSSWGINTTAEAGYEFVIGKLNVLNAGYNRTGWTLTDPLFVIGNGNPTPNNALTVLKNGNTGINTSSPEDLFQVGTGIAKVNIGTATGVNIGNGSSYIGFNASHQTIAGTWSTANNGTNNGGAIIYSNVLGDINFSTLPNTGATNQTGITDATVKSNIKFLIQTNGNVGIGTDLISNTANYKLSVNGNIRAKKIVVENTWADFVFENKYKLKSLVEVESFIKQNGHLSDIPSADEIQTNGIDLGDIVKLQMQKIEELTLYIIEQNKRIEALEKK